MKYREWSLEIILWDNVSLSIKFMSASQKNLPLIIWRPCSLHQLQGFSMYECPRKGTVYSISIKNVLTLCKRPSLYVGKMIKYRC